MPLDIVLSYVDGVMNSALAITLLPVVDLQLFFLAAVHNEGVIIMSCEVIFILDFAQAGAINLVSHCVVC